MHPRRAKTRQAAPKTRPKRPTQGHVGFKNRSEANPKCLPRRVWEAQAAQNPSGPRFSFILDGFFKIFVNVFDFLMDFRCIFHKFPSIDFRVLCASDVDIIALLLRCRVFLVYYHLVDLAPTADRRDHQAVFHMRRKNM